MTLRGNEDEPKRLDQISHNVRVGPKSGFRLEEIDPKTWAIKALPGGRDSIAVAARLRKR